MTFSQYICQLYLGKSDTEAGKLEAEAGISEKEEDISGTKTPVKKVLKKTGGKKKRSVSASGAKSPVKPREKWYTEFVDFHTKKQVIEEFLQDNSRRGSALPDEIKTDSIWISENEKECANIVVNTMMQGNLLDGIVNKTVRRQGLKRLHPLFSVYTFLKALQRTNILNDVKAAPFSVSFSQLPGAKKQHRQRCRCDVIKDVHT